MMNNNDIALINTGIDLLKQHRKVHLLSGLLTISTIVLALTLASLGKLSTEWVILMLTSIIFGLIETVFAIRVGFDQNLLARIANSKDTMGDTLSILDQSLSRLNLIKADKKDRDLNTRLHACLALFRKQAMLCGVQIAVLILPIIISSI